MRNGKIDGLAAIVLVFFVVWLGGCRNGDNSTPCTSEFRMLTVSVRDSASRPVILDSSYVRAVNSGIVYDFSTLDPLLDSINRLQGIFFLLTDSQMNATTRTGTGFEFHGFLGADEVVFSTYSIGNDGCHVKLIAGNQIIVY